MHLLIAMAAGALVLNLYNKHKRRGIDKCKTCGQLEQIGTMLKYIPFSTAAGNIETPYCKRCKPEIFPN